MLLFPIAHRAYSAYPRFGLVFLEAAALGRPSISAASGAVPEVIPSQAGALFPYGDDAALAQTIEEAVSRSRRGLLAPETIRKTFLERYYWRLFTDRRNSAVRDSRHVCGITPIFARSPQSSGLWFDGPEDRSLYDVWISNVNECAELNWYNVSCQYAVNDGIHISDSDTFSMFGGLLQSNQRTGIHLDGRPRPVPGPFASGPWPGSYGNYHVTIQSVVFFGAGRDKITPARGIAVFNNSQNMMVSNYTAGVANPVLTLDRNASFWPLANNGWLPGV